MATGLFQPRPATPAQAPAQPAVPAGRPSSELTVMASENNGAWTFGARWHADANAGMNVGDWFADFAHGLDSGIELPTFLKQLSVGAIDFSFDTGADRLAVGISATAGDPNAPKPDDITLDLALTAAPDIGGKDWKIEASGVLTRGDLTFSLTLDRGDGTRLIAMLQADPPVKATLDDLAQALGFGTGTTWPQVWLNFIAAVAVSDAPAGAGAPLPVQLVAVDLDLGIDLANLPLIGKLLTALGGFSLAFQLSYASRKLDPSAADAALVEAVNARLPPGATALPKPEQIGASLNLAAVLKVGEAQTRLALPIKADQATGNVVVDPAAAPQPPPSADGITWKTLNAQLGPITLARVGGRFDMGDATAVPRTDPSLTLLLDASVAMGPVAFAFKGLGVKATLQGTAVTAAFQIDGLGIDYRGGGVHISGALLPQGAEDFAGTALIATDAFSLTAVAAYTSAEGRKSLFVYGVLDKAIGGPAFFFVTGLAAGFGYNRTVVFPDIDHVADFPLIALAVPGTRKPGELTDEMATLRQSVPVAWDEYFLAAGIKFNSFKLIDSFVLLVVRFGDDLEFDLLGLSTAVLPPAVVGDTVAPIAKIQAAIKASYRPDEGVLRVQAQLTDASFLFDRKCQLRGGFAFYAWLKDQPGVAEAGDFVATIGGYHPRFDLGAHPGYPNVPRLSIDWPVSDALQIKADCYCALTPVAIMAGGHLSVSYQQDSIKAWFNAGFDFIMFWKPFHYTGHAYVDIGGSYTFNFFVEHTISIEVGATLDVSGPDFACAAHVSLYVVSFDVNYGVLNQMPDWLTWDKFVQAFLPETDLVRVSLAQGQLQQADQGGPAAVDATTLRIDCDSALPATALSYDNISYVLDLKTSAAVALAPGTAPTPLGVVPMGPGLGSYQATHQVTITYRPDPANPANATSAIDDFNWLPRLKQAPTALWGKPTNDSNDMLAQSNGVVAAYGITLTPKPAKAGSSTSPRDMSKLVDVVKAAATTCKMAKEDQATVIPAPRNWDGSVQAPGALDDAVISHADLRAALVDGFGFDPALDRPRAGFAAALRMPPLWRTDQVTVQ
jgi:hypothetical protein